MSKKKSTILSFKKFAITILVVSVASILIALLFSYSVTNNSTSGLAGALTAIVLTRWSIYLTSGLLVALSLWGVIYGVMRARKSRGYIIVALLPLLAVLAYWVVPSVVNVINTNHPDYKRYTQNYGLCVAAYGASTSYTQDERAQVQDMCGDKRLARSELTQLNEIHSNKIERARQEAQVVKLNHARELKPAIEEIYRLERMDLNAACHYIRNHKGNLHYAFMEVESIVYYDLADGRACDIQWVAYDGVMTTEEYLHSEYFEGV